MRITTRIATQRPHVLEVCALGLVGALMISAPAGASTSATSTKNVTPTVSVGAVGVAPGSLVTARLEGWPEGTATVGICGDDAVRGSEDCSLVGDVAVAVRSTSPTYVDLTVVAPPVPCPCVVRASKSGTDLVYTAPISLLGVATAPVHAGAASTANQLEVRSTVASSGSWLGGISRSLGGPAAKTLVVTLHNRGRVPIRNLRVVAAVGRGATSGSPLAVRTVAVVPGDGRVVVRVPMSLSAPAYGEYQVAGTVYGVDTPAQFSAQATNDPWALELVIPIALLALAQWLRRRERARAEADGGGPGSATALPTYPTRIPAEAHTPMWERISA